MEMVHENGMVEANGYGIGQEPTNEEFRAYFKVEEYFERLSIAEWLAEGDCTQDEFDLMCHRFHKLDFSCEEWESMAELFREIVKERS